MSKNKTTISSDELAKGLAFMDFFHKCDEKHFNSLEKEIGTKHILSWIAKEMNVPYFDKGTPEASYIVQNKKPIPFDCAIKNIKFVFMQPSTLRMGIITNNGEWASIKLNLITSGNWGYYVDAVRNNKVENNGQN